MSPDLNARQLETHRDALYKYAVRAVSDPHLAQDLVQDTFVAALGAADGFRGESTLRTWLVGILKHKITDAWRERSRAMVSLDEPAGDEAGEGATALDALRAEHQDPAYKLEQKRFWESFRALLERMPERTAQAFIAADLGGEGTDELCRRLGVSRNNLWVLRHRARQLLRGGMAPALPV